MYKAADISVKLQRNGDEVTQIMLGPIGCPETSLSNYQFTQRNIPEDCRSQGYTITMVILKFCSAEKFPFQKGTCQAPVRCVPSTSPSKPMAELHAVKYRAFEGHHYAVSFNPHQSTIATWRTPTGLPSVWRFGVPD